MLLMPFLLVCHQGTRANREVPLAVTAAVRHRLVLGLILHIVGAAARASDAVRPASADKPRFGSRVVGELLQKAQEQHLDLHTPSIACAEGMCQGNVLTLTRWHRLLSCWPVAPP